MKETSEVVVLILAGGKGERFWPKSRVSNPKQLQKVYSDKTLLNETIQRALTLTKIENIFIGTNASLKKSILEQEKSFPKNNFIIEPEGKNTAPIIALASLEFQEKFTNSIQVVLSADSFIDPLKNFTKTVQSGIEEASKNYLVLLGVKPSRPEIGYGYIEIKKSKEKSFSVSKFHEKPDVKTATKYLKKNSFYWNPGIFIWKTSLILEQFEKYSPDILDPLRQTYPFKKPGELQNAFRKIPSTPVDIAILERSEKIKMIPATFTWDDVGSWTSLERILKPQSGNNFHMGSEVYYYESKGNISISKKPFVSFLGVNNLIFIEVEDAILIAQKDSIDEIKKMIQSMKKNKSLQKYLE